MQIVSKLSLFFSFIPILLCQCTIQQKYRDQILLLATQIVSELLHWTHF